MSINLVVTLVALAAAASSLYPPVAPYTLAKLPEEEIRVPMIFPILGGAKWTNTYNADFKTHRHTGQDIPSPKMTPIVAPFSGVIGLKQFSFWINGDNGYRCLGTHLNDDNPGTNDGRGGRDFMFAPNVHHGSRVQAGQLIGYVGNSGQATGPHLHFEIYNSKNQIRNPIQSLKYSQIIKEPRLTFPAERLKPRPGEKLWIIAPRGATATHLTGIVIARETHTGAKSVDTYPNKATIRMVNGDAPVLTAGLIVGVIVSRVNGVLIGTRSEIYQLRQASAWGLNDSIPASQTKVSKR